LVARGGEGKSGRRPAGEGKDVKKKQRRLVLGKRGQQRG